MASFHIFTSLSFDLSVGNKTLTKPLKGQFIFHALVLATTIHQHITFEMSSRIPSRNRRVVPTLRKWLT